MTYTFKLSRRIARLRAPVFAALVLALGACDTDDTLAPTDATDSSPQVLIPTDGPLLAAAYAGGMPIGMTAQPNEAFGARYNGALRNIYPQFLDRDLSEIKSRGGKIALMMAGPDFNYKDADGHFSLTKWKARIDRYDDVNFDAFIKDGTLIGHYMIDEPNDPANWNGQPISGETLDEMGRYSKAKWPNLPTIVRTYPEYLEKWAPYRYVDAAWAQYVERKGDVDDFIADNVASAKRQGLGLVIGLNLLKGGANKSEMTASQVKSWGTALLTSSYPCAFISWKYDDGYVSSSAMKDAMDYLRKQAESHTFKTCAASSAGSTPTPPPPPPASSASAAAAVGGSPLPFGMFQAPLDEYSSEWTGAFYRADPTRIVRQLDRAGQAKMRIIVSLTSSSSSKNADGTFSLTKWKAQVDAYRSLGWPATCRARRCTRTTWWTSRTARPAGAAGRSPGRRSRRWRATASRCGRAWPRPCPTAPTTLADASFRWSYLDAGWAQYTTRRGDAKAFAASRGSAAKAEGLGLILGVSFLEAAGGDTRADDGQPDQADRDRARQGTVGVRPGRMEARRRVPEPERHPPGARRRGDRRQVAHRGVVRRQLTRA